MLKITALLGTLGIAFLAASPAHAQTSAAHYRDFQLGGDIASVASASGVAASDAKTVHARPAMLQELEWRRPYTLNGSISEDPVRQIAFSFYNDQLFRLLIDYDRKRTEGMTDADMIDAISTMYGSPVKPVLRAARASVPPIEQESGTRIAGWGDAEYTAVLYRSQYASGFSLVVTSVPLNALAQTAKAQAVRLDERDAPERERARQKKEADEAEASSDKARLANKATFKP